MHNLSEKVNRKFVDSLDLSNLEIETDTGWQPISKIHKTAPYDVWEIHTDSGLTLHCADDHIVFTDLGREVFVKNLIENQSKILTVNGTETVIRVLKYSHNENMYDITVDSNDHRYFTNGILSHNTTMIQALSYGLFGTPINQIRKDNLINRTNGKGMMVTVEYSSNGVEYKIERGRRPNVLRFYKNGIIQKEDKDNFAQGENKDTQKDIERTLGMTSDMFRHIVALNTYTEPFLALGAGQQRAIIEQLLGITLLSEKAETLKEKIKTNKDQILIEEVQVRAIEESNKRVQEQIDALTRRQSLWQKQHDEVLARLVNDYDELSKIDIEKELQAHKDLSVYNENKKKMEQYKSILARQTAWQQKQASDTKVLQDRYDKLCHIDIDTELQAHKDLASYNAKKVELESLNKIIVSLESTCNKDQTLVSKIKNELQTLEENKCYACGQDFHDENHAAVINEKRNLLSVAISELTQNQNELEKHKNSLFVLGNAPITYYATEADAIKHGSEIERIQQQIDSKKNEEDPYAEQLTEYTVTNIGNMPMTIYDTEAEAIEHRTIIANLEKTIAAKAAETDPYTDQLVEMRQRALQEISFDKINELSKFGDHLKFLIELLTSRDSFVRKKIIDQNLSYLNSRLTHYLDKIGLPHTVVFKNDLSVEITELGRELDFYNLSRGEMNRVILALSFAFRDVWENLYSPINTLFIDELIDSGMDSIGLENSLSILKTMSRTRKKSIWLVSHKEELASRVDKVLRVIKEAGFTSYVTGDEEEVELPNA